MATPRSSVRASAVTSLVCLCLGLLVIAAGLVVPAVVRRKLHDGVRRRVCGAVVVVVQGNCVHACAAQRGARIGVVCERACLPLCWRTLASRTRLMHTPCGAPGALLVCWPRPQILDTIIWRPDSPALTQGSVASCRRCSCARASLSAHRLQRNGVERSRLASITTLNAPVCRCRFAARRAPQSASATRSLGRTRRGTCSACSCSTSQTWRTCSSARCPSWCAGPRCCASACMVACRRSRRPQRAHRAAAASLCCVPCAVRCVPCAARCVLCSTWCSCACPGASGAVRAPRGAREARRAVG
jgi:hypothetical protein